MNLYEYEGVALFQKYGIPVPRGGLASSPDEARKIAERLNPPYVVKAQVLIGGRGKAGGVRFAETPEEVENVAEEVLGIVIRGVRVDKILVVEKIKIMRELYLSFVLNRSEKTVDFLASPLGGVDIEDIACLLYTSPSPRDRG